MTEPSVEGLRGVGYYRILGRGTVGHPASVAVTESIVARPWGEGFAPAAFPANPDAPEFCQQLEVAEGEQLPCGLQAWRQRR
jgi:hypothetical protein